METYAPIVRYHQYTGLILAYPIAGVYDHSALSVRIARASELLHTTILPPARLELDRNFDRRAIVQGADGLALLIGHRDTVGVDGAEVSKCGSRNNVGEAFVLLACNTDPHRRECGIGEKRGGFLSNRRDAVIVKRLGFQLGEHRLDQDLAAAFQAIPIDSIALRGIIEFKRVKDGLWVNLSMTSAR
jgi:hypothetical protein